MKRSEKKKRPKSQDKHVNTESDETINLISDDEAANTPPRNSMQEIFRHQKVLFTVVTMIAMGRNSLVDKAMEKYAFKATF